MFVAKVKRIVNPHRTKKRKAAAKKTKRRVMRKANGQFVKKSKRRAKKTSKRKVRRSNPAQLLTLGLAGLANPHKPRKRRNKGMATKKAKRKSPKRVAAAKKAARTRKRRMMAKSSPHKHHRRRSAARKTSQRRKNSTRVIVMAPKRRNGRRRHNPELFGQHLSMGQAAKMVAAGLVGVTATKLVVPMIPGGLTSSPIGAAIASIIVAIGGGWLIGKWDKSAGSGFAFGGLMQAGSIMLNMIPVPGVSQFALSGYRGGIGDFVPASFPIPQIPILLNGASGGPGGAAGAGRSGRRAYGNPYAA